MSTSEGGIPLIALSAQKYRTNGPVDSLLFLPLAERLSQLLYCCGLTPNGVTTLSLLTGLVALVCCWLGWPLAATLLFACYYLLDCADGIMARQFNLCSDFGEVYDYLKDVGMFFCYSWVLISLAGMWLYPVSVVLGLYLIVWEGAMDCRACHGKHGHFDFYASIVRRQLFWPYRALMFVCYQAGRRVVHWPLHWFGSGEFVAVVLLILAILTPNK